MKQAENPLKNPELLFKQTEPPLIAFGLTLGL